MSQAPLQLDLVAPARPAARWVGYLVLAGSLAIAGEILLRWQETQAALRRFEAAQSLLGAVRPARTLPRERLEEETKAAQATIRQLALPWARLIESLERAATPSVAVLLVQPDAQQRLLRVTAEARVPEAMLDYLRRLESSPVLAEIHLVSHQLRDDDPRRPIQFTLQASFR